MAVHIANPYSGKSVSAARRNVTAGLSSRRDFVERGGSSITKRVLSPGARAVVIAGSVLVS
jgi:hypothetical protein